MTSDDGELERLLDEARADQAADARVRERWLRRQAEEERHLASSWGAEPTDHEVAGYWRSLIDANRPRLPDPDLLHVGTVLVLPPVPPAP